MKTILIALAVIFGLCIIALWVYCTIIAHDITKNDEINVRIEAKRYAYIGKRWLKTMYKTDDIIRITRDVYEVRKGKTIWKVKIIRI